jgi:hypothetical protein
MGAGLPVMGRVPVWDEMGVLNTQLTILLNGLDLIYCEVDDKAIMSKAIMILRDAVEQMQAPCAITIPVKRLREKRAGK